jgi:hypothetical protein
MSPELACYFSQGPHTHDIADAALFTIMWMQEEFGIPALGMPAPMEASGCVLARRLADLYQRTKATCRDGSNVARRSVVANRIAASEVRLLFSARILEAGPKFVLACGATELMPISNCKDYGLFSLTRENMRFTGMPISEAADLSQFARLCIAAMHPRATGLVLHFRGVALAMCKLWKAYDTKTVVKGTGVPTKMLGAFMAIMTSLGDNLPVVPM